MILMNLHGPKKDDPDFYFEVFAKLVSIWRMRNELHKYKQLLRYQGRRVLQ